MQAEKRIIWGFPGCGKSFFAKQCSNLSVVDADCRLFEFARVHEELLHGGFGGLAERNLDYPGNYLEYVKTCSADVVLVNCHLGLLSEFPGVEIIYPAKELKGEYLGRYRKRGDDESFLSYMDEVFEQMVELIEGMEGVQKYRMEDPVMYLSDVMNKMDVLRKERGNDMKGKTYIIDGMDLSDAPSEVELLEDAIQEKKMIEEIESYETAFRNACKDMIEMCYSKENLHKILDEEWEQFKGTKYRPLDSKNLYGKEQEESDKKVVEWTSDVTIKVNEKEYDLYCEFADGCFLFKEKEAQDVLILQNGEMIQGFFSLETNRVKDLLTYINSMPDLNISLTTKDFEKQCIEALKRGEIYPRLYQDEMLSEVKNSMTFLQRIALQRQSQKGSVLSKDFLNFMKLVDEYTVQVGEKGLEKEVALEKSYIPEEPEDNTRIVPAASLPKGWNWVQYDDGSGSLESPEGKSYFLYDWNTGEYKTTDEDKYYDFYLNENYDTGGYSIGSFVEFKEYAENVIKERILGISMENKTRDCDDLTAQIQNAAKECESLSKNKGVVGKETEKEFGR